MITLTGRLRAARGRWAPPSRWALARRFVLPVLICWESATDVVTRPWLAVPVFLVTMALLARFAWPATALLLATALPGLWLWALVAIPVTAYAAGKRIGSAGRVIAVFAAAVVLLALTILLKITSNEVPLLPDAATAAVACIVGGVILPGLAGVWAGERARRIDTLRERNALLERANELGEIQAIMQERARIAGEMHDLLGHRLALISLHSGALEMVARTRAPDLSEQALLLRTTAKTAMDELRGVLGVLRVDAHGQDIDGSDDEAGTRDDVTELVVSSRRAGLLVELAWDGPDLTGVDGRVRRAVHRVVREGLTNVHKHAPQAATDVRVVCGKAAVLVEVRNRLGPPLSRPAPGTNLGLAGLRERVRLLGGTIDTGADEDRRLFVVMASIPLVPPQDGELPSKRPHSSASGPASPPKSGAVKSIRRVVLGVIAVVGAAVVIGAGTLAWMLNQVKLSAESYQTIHIGQTEAQVRQVIGTPGEIARLVLLQDEPSIPAGAVCSYSISRQSSEVGPTPVYRFCFNGGKLVEKEEIPQSDRS